MIKIGGDDVFKGSKYDWHAWSADVVQTPRELREAFEALHVIGKRVADLLAVGGAWEEIDNTCGVGLETYDPYILVFEDGDRLEIFDAETSSFRLSVNCFPKDLADIEPVDDILDGKKFISPCIGKELIGLDVGELDDCPWLDFTESYGMTLDTELEAYIWYLDLLLEGGLKLRFWPAWDNGHIYLLDAQGEPYWRSPWKEEPEEQDGLEER